MIRMPVDQSGLFTVQLEDSNEPIDLALARSIAAPQSPLIDLPALTQVALGDPYLAEQLATLRRTFELRPAPAPGLLARIRTRVAWWLLGPELQQANQVHATLMRIIDSLVVLADAERVARRRIEER